MEPGKYRYAAKQGLLIKIVSESSYPGCLKCVSLNVKTGEVSEHDFEKSFLEEDTTETSPTAVESYKKGVVNMINNF